MGFLVTRACRLAMQNITVLVPHVGFRLAVRKVLCHKDKLVKSAQIRRFAFRPSFVIERAIPQRPRLRLVWLNPRMSNHEERTPET